jgi:hypothetical protein
MKYQVTVKVQNSNDEFNTEVEARNEWHSTSMAMAKYPNKLSGQLIMYRVKDENGNLLIKQF